MCVCTHMGHGTPLDVHTLIQQTLATVEPLGAGNGARQENLLSLYKLFFFKKNNAQIS